MSLANRIVQGMLAWFEDRKHWEQHHLMTSEPDPNGEPGAMVVTSTCLIGGADMVYEWVPGNDHEALTLMYSTLAQVIREQFPDKLCDGEKKWMDVIIGFNDDPSTTIEDVRAVLEKTGVRLQEEG